MTHGRSSRRAVAASGSTPAPAPAPARRELLLGGERVDYELRRSRRRSIGLVIGREGLRVSAPRWVALGEIERALREKAAWVVRKLAEQRERDATLQAARVDWRDGAVLPFLGEPLVLALTGAGDHDREATRAEAATAATGPDARDHAAHPADTPGLPAAPRRLALPLPPGAPAEHIRDAACAWLQSQARALFGQRCAHYEPVLGVRMRRLALTAAATRWGSAGADGTIRLNWRLVHLPLPVIDYVVVHELAHLRHMNHGPAFWALVVSAVPDVAAARRALRQVPPVVG